MKEDDLLRLVRDLNGVSLPAERVGRMQPLVVDVNARVNAAADRLVTIDSVPWSFLTVRQAEGEGDRS